MLSIREILRIGDRLRRIEFHWRRVSRDPIFVTLPEPLDLFRSTDFFNELRRPPPAVANLQERAIRGRQSDSKFPLHLYQLAFRRARCSKPLSLPRTGGHLRRERRC